LSTFRSINPLQCRYPDFRKLGILDKQQLEVLLFLVFFWVPEVWYIAGSHIERAKILSTYLQRFACCPCKVWVEKEFTWLFFNFLFVGSWKRFNCSSCNTVYTSPKADNSSFEWRLRVICLIKNKRIVMKILYKSKGW
jgi:hypothetical protein